MHLYEQLVRSGVAPSEAEALTAQVGEDLDKNKDGYANAALWMKKELIQQFEETLDELSEEDAVTPIESERLRHLQDWQKVFLELTCIVPENMLLETLGKLCEEVTNGQAAKRVASEMKEVCSLVRKFGKRLTHKQIQDKHDFAKFLKESEAITM